MGNFSLGVSRRDLILFAGASVVGIALTILWHLFLIGPISSLFQANAQIANKYFLTAVLTGLSFVVTLASLAIAPRERRENDRPVTRGLRSRLGSLLPGFLVRFGLALEIIGILITPIGLYYATDPNRSVPIGFASFTMVFLGLFLAGIGGNMLAPRRA